VAPSVLFDEADHPALTSSDTPSAGKACLYASIITSLATITFNKLSA
jgi:hypothetical protein